VVTEGPLCGSLSLSLRVSLSLSKSLSLPLSPFLRLGPRTSVQRTVTQFSHELRVRGERHVASREPERSSASPGKPCLESRTATEALGLPAEAHERTHPLGVRTRGSDGNNSTQPRYACTHPSAAGTGRRKHARVRQSAHGGLFDSRSKPTQQRAQRRHGKRVVLAVFDHLGDVMMTLFRKRTCRG